MNAIPIGKVRPVRLVFAVLLAVAAVGATTQAFGYWLPWAKEEDKIKKVLTDVWQALLDGDQRTLQSSLTGKAVGPFIEQETEYIKQQGVKTYKLTFKKISVSQAGMSMGFVEYEREARLKDGRTVISPTLSVLQHQEGAWKLVTGMGVKKPPEAAAKAETQLADKGKTATTFGPELDRVRELMFEDMGARKY